MILRFFFLLINVGIGALLHINIPHYLVNSKIDAPNPTEYFYITRKCIKTTSESIANYFFKNVKIIIYVKEL